MLIAHSLFFIVWQSSGSSTDGHSSTVLELSLVQTIKGGSVVQQTGLWARRPEVPRYAADKWLELE